MKSYSLPTKKDGTYKIVGAPILCQSNSTRFLVLSNSARLREVLDGSTYNYVLLLIFLWNLQPWFKIELKPVNKPKKVTTEGQAQKNADKAFQSKVEIINYSVRPGDTLSEIAERDGVCL